jgi:hypothetical protein
MRHLQMSTTVLVAAIFLLVPVRMFAHCDSVAGPVARDVKRALESGQLSPVLKWILETDEPELRAAFNRTLAVRKLGTEAADLADTFFLETAVRLHRASENQPYTGLKRDSAVHDSALSLVDSALATGALEPVKIFALAGTRAELEKRIDAVVRARKSADTSPELGREYVKAYITFIHYIDSLQPSTDEHRQDPKEIIH